jgi:hypothetical protein
MSKGTIPASTSFGDDANFNAGQQDQSFDDMAVPMGPMAKHLGIELDLPEDDDDVAPEDSVDIDVPEVDNTDEDDNEDHDDDTSEEDDGEEDDEDSTHEAELLSEEDIDWEYKVPVKIDGVEQHLTLEELRKGYATDQSLSKKGNKISEERKEFDLEHSTRMDELSGLAAVLQEQLQGEEDGLAKEYHDIEGKIKEARKEGNTYELSELKDQREAAQEAYWTARKKREGTATAVGEKQKAQLALQQKELSEKFNIDIAELVPTFQDDAEAIQAFAIEEGIPSELLPMIADANVIKFIDDYRKLKQKASKGAVKRKATPKAKSAPIKKGPSRNQKQEKATGKIRSRVLAGDSSATDQMDFLKNISKFR